MSAVYQDMNHCMQTLPDDCKSVYTLDDCYATCIATVFAVHTLYDLGVCENYCNDNVVTRTVHVRISMEGGK